MPLKFSPISWERLRVGQEFSPGAFFLSTIVAAVMVVVVRQSGESTAPRGRFSHGEREQEEGGGEKRIRVEGTRFLNSFVRNRYPVPKSASLRDICTHTRVGNREREKERKTKWFARVHAKWRVGKREGGKKKEERREEKRERGGGNRYAEFSQWDWKGTILFPVASTQSFHGKLLGVQRRSPFLRRRKKVDIEWWWKTRERERGDSFFESEPFRMQKIERAPQSERNLETQFPERPTERRASASVLSPLSSLSLSLADRTIHLRTMNATLITHPCIPSTTTFRHRRCFSFRIASQPILSHRVISRFHPRYIMTSKYHSDVASGIERCSTPKRD